MSDNPFITQLASMRQAQTRIIEALGVPYADPFNEEAIIADVNDPEKRGRVKVTTKDNLTSDWIPVSGSNSGVLSARYIGAEVLVGKTNGRSDSMYVIGIFRSAPEIGITGNPIQLPIIDEGMAVWNESSDSGMKCNEGNKGRMYVLSNEMHQDVVVCLRRTNNQLGSKPRWAWKSITNGLWVEKGFNPGNADTPAVGQAQRRNPGIPVCDESLLGEIHEFTEDRAFRTTTMVCRRDENKNFSWMPLSAPPVFFRSLLPTCTEKVHGMEAIADDGVNSELVICQRYQGLMRWVRQGSRNPNKFHSKGELISRIQFNSNFKDISSLKEQVNEDWQKSPDIVEVAFDAAMSSIPLTGTDPELKILLQAASMVPATAFDGAQALKRVAYEALNKKTGIPVETLTQLLREELDSNGSLTPATAQLLSGLGRSVDVLVNGTLDGDVEGALRDIGQTTLRNALLTLEPRAASVMTGLMSGGISGAIDSAVAVGLDELPPEVNKYVKPVIGIAKDLLMSKYPASLGNILNSASGGGLLSAVSGTINGAIKANVVTPQLLGTLATSISDGSLGEIPKLFSSLGNLSAIPKLSGDLGSLPKLASTALGLVGQAKAMSNLLGNGGIGLDNVSQLIGGGFSAASTIVGGIKALGGIFGKSSGCPCGSSCRKIKHGESSDGDNVLESCRSAIANNATGYNPDGNPLNNNFNPVAEDVGNKPTGVGSDIIPKNLRDLTGYIEKNPRVRQMAEKFHDSRYADWPELAAEFAYTFENVEKGFKFTDNNITRVESIEKKLIDTLYNMLSAIVYDRKGSGRDLAIVPRLIRDVRENSQAIKDLYKFAEKLDNVKNGGRAGVKVTTNLARSFQNIPDLQSLLSLNRREALKLLKNGVVPAYREWKTLGNVGSIGKYGGTLPDPFSKESTIFNRDKVLAVSLESKLGDNLSDQPGTLSDYVLSQEQLDALRSSPEDFERLSKDLPNQLNEGESSLYDSVINRRGQTSCE